MRNTVKGSDNEVGDGELDVTCSPPSYEKEPKKRITRCQTVDQRDPAILFATR